MFHLLRMATHLLPDRATHERPDLGAYLPALAATLIAACAGTVSERPTRAAEPEPFSATHAEPAERADSAGESDASVAAEEREVTSSPEPARKPTFSDEERTRIASLQRFVRTAAKKHELPASLINAVIWVESRFTTRARGKRGPRGLMQLMPKTGRLIARELGRRYEPYGADFNIDAGAYYLANMIELFDGNVSLGLSAYATGPARVRSALDGGEPLSEQAQAYARSVLAAQAAFDDESF